MTKKYIVFLAIFFLILLVVLANIYQNKDNFEIKIEANFSNMDAEKIDSSFSKIIKNELLQVDEIKKLVIYSRDNKCTIYSKIKPSIFSKRQISDKIEKKLNLALNKTLNNAEIQFENDYNLKYDTFVVVSSKKYTHNKIKDICDDIFNQLLGENFSSKILKFGEIEKAIYINFDNSTLLKYSISLKDIIKTIKNNNILESSALKINRNTSYPIKINGNIENVNDIKNIVIPYKNNMFSIKFKDIFEIDEKTLTPPNYKVKFNEKNAEILAISKRKFYFTPIYLMKLKKVLNNFQDKNTKIEILNTSKLKKIEIILENKANIYKTENLANKIEKLSQNKIKNIIFIIGHDIPKISNKEVYFENEKAKLILLVQKSDYEKLKKLLNENNISYTKENSKNYFLYDTNIKKLNQKQNGIINYLKSNKDVKNYSLETLSKVHKIYYKIYDYTMNDYKTSKENIINSIFAINNSLFCDYYFEDLRKIPIYLQNKNKVKREYVYIKETNTLNYLGTLAKNNLVESFYIIPRENEKYFSKINVEFKSNNLIKNFILNLSIKKKIKKPFLI